MGQRAFARGVDADSTAASRGGIGLPRGRAGSVASNGRPVVGRKQTMQRSGVRRGRVALPMGQGRSGSQRCVRVVARGKAAR
jgi:hypothetical protein